MFTSLFIRVLRVVSMPFFHTGVDKGLVEFTGLTGLVGFEIWITMTGRNMVSWPYRLDMA